MYPWLNYYHTHFEVKITPQQWSTKWKSLGDKIVLLKVLADCIHSSFVEALLHKWAAKYSTEPHVSHKMEHTVDLSIQKLKEIEICVEIRRTITDRGGFYCYKQETGQYATVVHNAQYYSSLCFLLQLTASSPASDTNV